MKHVLVWMIASVLLNGTAWAQTTEQDQPVEQNKVPGCTRPANYTVENWNEMSAGGQRRGCEWEASAAVSRAAMAAREVERARSEAASAATLATIVAVEAENAKRQDAVNAPVVSKKLGIVGVVTALAGVAVLGPWGDQYHILGNTYCVTEHSVYDGSCNAKGKQAAIGAGLIGGGVLMAWAGLRRVAVSPQVSKTGVGATATVRWGGSRGRTK